MPFNVPGFIYIVLAHESNKTRIETRPSRSIIPTIYRVLAHESNKTRIETLFDPGAL